MHIALLCATDRGRIFLEHLHDRLPDSELTVFSFREEPWEPPFLENIRRSARDRGARFAETRDVASASADGVWQRAPVDLLFAVNWRYHVKKTIYGRPRLGSFVFHDSLLPSYRGFSPTVWAIINGEPATGASLIEMSERVDSGAIVDQRVVQISADETITDVMGRVTAAYLDLLDHNLPDLLAGRAPRTPQEDARATYGCKRLPEDDRIDWSAPTRRIHDLIRAVTRPYPGAFTFFRGQRLTVWAAKTLPEERRYVGRVPGRVVEVRKGEGVLVLTGDGCLLLTQVQVAGQETLPAWSALSRANETLGA